MLGGQGVKKLIVGKNLPDMGSFEDISDYIRAYELQKEFISLVSRSIRRFVRARERRYEQARREESVGVTGQGGIAFNEHGTSHSIR